MYTLILAKVQKNSAVWHSPKKLMKNLPPMVNNTKPESPFLALAYCTCTQWYLLIDEPLKVFFIIL